MTLVSIKSYQFPSLVLSFMINGNFPLLGVFCVQHISQTPALYKNFLSFFIMPPHDRVLILCDFDIHVCCPASSFTSDFLNLCDSFSLVQHIKGPSHSNGHTLDLVLSYGVSLDRAKLTDFPASDYKAVIFNSLLLFSGPKLQIFKRSRFLNSNSVNQFCKAFQIVSSPLMSEQLLPTTDSLLADFIQTCPSILNDTAFFKEKVVKPSALPGLMTTPETSEDDVGN